MKIIINETTVNTKLNIIPAFGIAIGRDRIKRHYKKGACYTFILLCFSFELTISKSC